MSNPDFMPSRRSVTFPADAKCPEGYVLVKSVNANHSRPHTHLAPYSSFSALVRGVTGAYASTLCEKAIRRNWHLMSTVRDDGTPTRTTCRACLSAIRKALA